MRMHTVIAIVNIVDCTAMHARINVIHQRKVGIRLLIDTILPKFIGGLPEMVTNNLDLDLKTEAPRVVHNLIELDTLRTNDFDALIDE